MYSVPGTLKSTLYSVNCTLKSTLTESLCEVNECKVTTFGRVRQKKVAHNEVFNFLMGVKEVVCGVEVAKDYTRLSR